MKTGKRALLRVALNSFNARKLMRHAMEVNRLKTGAVLASVSDDGKSATAQTIEVTTRT